METNNTAAARNAHNLRLNRHQSLDQFANAVDYALECRMDDAEIAHRLYGLLSLLRSVQASPVWHLQIPGGTMRVALRWGGATCTIVPDDGDGPIVEGAVARWRGAGGRTDDDVRAVWRNMIAQWIAGDDSDDEHAILRTAATRWRLLTI